MESTIFLKRCTTPLALSAIVFLIGFLIGGGLASAGSFSSDLGILSNKELGVEEFTKGDVIFNKILENNLKVTGILAIPFLAGIISLLSLLTNGVYLVLC